LSLLLRSLALLRRAQRTPAWQNFVVDDFPIISALKMQALRLNLHYYFNWSLPWNSKIARLGLAKKQISNQTEKLTSIL
jgi:hypothetical protein